jgi:CPA2 family monovalent cation:H+ antiporter-2
MAGIWGDITSEQILDAARATSARILLLTVPDPNSIRLSVERARQLNPAILIIARALRTDQISELRKWGVNTVVQPEFEGGIEMVRQALVPYTGADAAALRLHSDVRSDFYGGAALDSGPAR